MNQMRHASMNNYKLTYTTTNGKYLRSRLLRCVLCFFLLMVASANIWGQSATLPSGDGYYYITSNNTAYYLKPATNYYNSNTETPFLTTNQTGQVSGSLWIVKRNGDYYHVIHAEDMKYVTTNGVVISDQAHRKRMHLETLDTPGDANDFVFTINDTKYNISHKTMTEGAHKYWNPSGGNQTYDNGGSNGYSGIVGLYNNANDANSLWTFTFVSKCVTPEIRLSGPLEVTITTVTPGATIYYTTDGTDPTTASTLYTGPFTISGSGATAVKALAVKTDFTDSDIASNTFTFAQMPTFDQTNCDNSVALTCATTGATIYYTLDGTDPTTSSAVYSTPLYPTAGQTIKTFAHVEGGGLPSNVNTLTYSPLYSAVPVISVEGNSVTITGSGSLYYTLDGTDPTTSSTLYTTPFDVPGSSTTVTIKAVAQDGALFASCVASKTMMPAVYISSVSDLEGVADHPDYVYIVTADFDASGFDADIINFSGSFDGDYHIISGLGQAMFNSIQGGTVKNVILDDVSINGLSHVGAIANTATGSSRIYNCGVLSTSDNSSISSTGGCAGGIVGMIEDDTRVVNCFNYASVSGGTYAGGIVGRNNGSTTRIALCMMYGDLSGGSETDGSSPVYAGNHTSNVQNFTEYNYWRSRANVTYQKYNDQLAIGDDNHLTRFPFYRHILNTHRQMGAYFLFGTSASTVNDLTNAQIHEIGHWVLKPEVAPYPIIEAWGTNTKRTTEDIAANLPSTTEERQGKLLTEMGNHGYLTVNLTINGSSYSTQLPITDMNEARYDYTWGKVVLPFANEFSGWTRDYSKVCTGWEITSVTGGTVGTFQHYDVADRNCTAKDLYANSNYIFAQGGNYIVPYGVTAIQITAHFANAFYLSDPGYEVGYKADYTSPTALGGNVPTTYHGQTVYTNLATLVSNLATTTNPHDQAIVLVGNFHYSVANANGVMLNTGKAVTIMSSDEDNNQEPDYGWYSRNGLGRLEVPPLRFDFLPNIEMGMSSRVGTGAYPGIGIWHTRGWFELTETCVSNMSQCEINSDNFTNLDNGTGNNRWIANSGCFVQIVRARDGNCVKLSYIQIGGNAYVKELYPGSHTNQARTSASVPICVTGGQVDECYMTGYKAGGTLSGDMIYFWCAGGKIGKFLGAYLENPSTAGLTARVDHALINRFFGGGTSSSANIKGDIDITINNSHVNFYCGGPEFGDMVSGKKVTTHATNTIFDDYYGAGFGGTSITYNREAQNDQLAIGNNETTTYDLAFTYYTNNRLKNKTYGIGSCYKFEYIFNSNGSVGVTRFYTGYAQFSLATTGNVTNILNGCTITNDFYGAGCQGKVSGTVTSTLTDCNVGGSAFGGGYKAESNEVPVYTTTQPAYSVYTRETGLFSDFGTVEPETFIWKQGTVGTSNATLKELYTNVVMSDLGNVTGAISITVDGGTITGDVYGGGNESKSLNNATVTILNTALVNHDIYGGGNQANVEGNATVNLVGGTVSGNVYGGGRGTADIAAIIGGNVLVELNNGVADNAKGCVIGGNIFGCNNINGTPLGTVLVHIFKTQNPVANRIANDETNGITDAKVVGRYDVAAVYGGGNQAAYIPADLVNGKTQVIIDGCEQTSIRKVYGGGNAATTPATSVTVNASYEIDEVFGGGNGKDPIDVNTPNPGANVGYYTYPDDATYEVRNADPYVYGTGRAEVFILGGTIHAVYGGSDTKGNVRQIAIAMLESQGDCPMNVDEAYGGGKSAPMDGISQLDMKCIPGLVAAYGGAENADVNNDVVLNITNGNFRQVFGGNNKGGRIMGSITVNIEETGCRPIIIGELYGGGNQAPYSVYGYEEKLDDGGNIVTDEAGNPVWVAKTSGDNPYPNPQVNVRSFTSIGNIYGGGYGASAVLVGNPQVNINQVAGLYASQIDGDGDNVADGDATQLGVIGNVYGGGNQAAVIGDTYICVATAETTDFVTMAEGETTPRTGVAVQGAHITGNVFGGGNQAEVQGDSHVVVGATAQ